MNMVIKIIQTVTEKYMVKEVVIMYVILNII